MPSLMLRNIPNDAYTALKREAKRNHRSLNAEVLAPAEGQGRNGSTARAGGPSHEEARRFAD